MYIYKIPNLLNESLGETSNLFLNVPWVSLITSLVKIALLSSKTKEGPDYSGTFVFIFFFLAARHGLSRIKPLFPVVNPWTIREVPVIN